MRDLASDPPVDSVSYEDVLHAANRIAGHVRHTPVMTCAAIDDWIGTRVFIKCENFQKTGAFKYRGALNAVAQLTPAQLRFGVVTHSSGNHAAALAAAATKFGTSARIVMPNNSSAVKIAAVKNYGGQVTECEPTLADRELVANRIQRETGAEMIPPFNDRRVIAGQGTCGLEFCRQVPYLDAIVAPIGGGGLMSGTCIAARHSIDGITIWGAEPEGADDAFRSRESGTRITEMTPNTICDGLRTTLGDLTWPYIRDQVDDILLANDDQTVDAMRFVWERAKIVIEPSAAVIFAALKNRMDAMAPEQRPCHVGIIACGGNVDLQHLPW